MQSAFFPAQQQGQQQQAVSVSAAAPQGHNKTATVTHTNIPSRTAPGSINPCSTAGASSSRTLRFPSSRRYLWDRTAAGPQVLVDVLDYLPHVQVAASTFGAVSRAASSNASSLTLQLDLAVSATNQVTALIQEHDPLSTQRCLQLRCTLSEPASAVTDAASSLCGVMQAHVDQRDIARVQQLYALVATATAAPSPAEPASLRLQLLMPRAGMLATPLYTKRLCHVPLAETLLKPGCMAAGQTGYLSMDQARSLLPMEATDANVYSTPLVGVWVKGPSGVLHPLVAAACLRFAFSSLLMDRAVNPEDGSFLLLLCPEGDPVSKCFEVHMTDNRQLELCCYRCEAGVRPTAGMSQFPGGLVSATWVPEQRHIQPLPGTLTPAASGAGLLAGRAGTSHTAAAPPGATASRSAALIHSRLDPAAMAADSPILQGSSHISRAAELPLCRSSATSAALSNTAAGDLQHDPAAAAVAARRSLPLTFGASRHASSSLGAFGASGRPWQTHRAGGLAALYPEEPQPRTGVPAVPYVPSTQLANSRQPGQEQQEGQQWGMHAKHGFFSTHDAGGSTAGGAAAAALASPLNACAGSPAGPVVNGADGISSTCSSPSKAARQQQLSWSDRQDQVLRSSLEGAAEALRASQASLAAARDAASGAGSRLSSPTKGCNNMGDVRPASASAAGAAHYDTGCLSAAGGAVGQAGQIPGPAGGATGSPQPVLSRLGQQQQQQPVDVDAESDCGLRMGSPVRASMQKKASMLAAAAAHAAGFSPPPGAGAAGDGVERPVSPAVQAGVALSNLSLLQHLSSGQLQQALEHPHPPSSCAQQLVGQEEHVLDAVGHAAVAAAAGGQATAVVSGGCPAAQSQQQQSWWPEQVQPCGTYIHISQHQPVPPVAAPGYSPPAPAYSTGLHGAPAGAAVTESLDASHAAAAAIQAASSSMQRVPVHPYSHSLGVQRYAADVAVMHASSQGSPRACDLLSPGSSPGIMYHDCTGLRWQQQQQQQQGMHGQLPPAWSPGPPAAMQGLSSSMRGSPYWQQQRQQQQQQQQVSPMSAGASPGWVPDPLAQALQGEVDRLRQQLQQLQHQLRLAGMSLSGPDLDASAASTPAALLPPQTLPAALQGMVQPAQTPDTHSLGQQAQQHRQGALAAEPGHTVSASGSQGPVAAAAEAVCREQQQQPQQQHHTVQEGAAPQDQAAQTEHAAAQPAAAAPSLQLARADARGGMDAAAPHADPANLDSSIHGAAGGASAGPVVEGGGGGRGSSCHSSGVEGVAAGSSITAQEAASRPCAVARHDTSAGEQACSRDTDAAGELAAATTTAGAGAPAATAAGAAVVSLYRHVSEPPRPQGDSKQQESDAAAAAAARQRRRKLDFDAAGAAVGADQGSDAGSPSSNACADAAAAEVQGTGVDSTTRVAAGLSGGAAGSMRAAAPRGAQEWTAQLTGSTCVADPVPCNSPGMPRIERSVHTDAATNTHAARAVAVPAVPASRASAMHSSAAGMRYSVRSSGGGLGHLRASLDAPALVEVVRARVVDLSDDSSDEDDWEDRLLVKYGLK